jgi:hypothetical protein
MMLANVEQKAGQDEWSNCFESEASRRQYARRPLYLERLFCASPFCSSAVYGVLAVIPNVVGLENLPNQTPYCAEIRMCGMNNSFSVLAEGC